MSNKNLSTGGRSVFVHRSEYQLSWDALLGVVNGCDWFSASLEIKLAEDWKWPALLDEAVLAAGYRLAREEHPRTYRDHANTRSISFAPGQLLLSTQGERWVNAEDDGGVQDGVLLFLLNHHAKAILSYRIEYNNSSPYGPSDRLPQWKSKRQTKALLAEIAEPRAKILFSWPPFGKNRRGRVYLAYGDRNSWSSHKEPPCEFLIRPGFYRVHAVIPFLSFPEFDPQANKAMFGLQQRPIRRSNAIQLQTEPNQTHRLRAKWNSEDLRLEAKELATIVHAAAGTLAPKETLTLEYEND